MTDNVYLYSVYLYMLILRQRARISNQNIIE